MSSFFFVSYAQKIKINLGKNEIGLNQVFQITVTIENERLQNYSPFPNIKGFTKQGTSNSTQTNIINGRVSATQSITQNYQPTKQGTFQLPDFSMKINGKTLQVQGTTIKVGSPVQQQQNHDPWADLFGRSKKNTPDEYLDVKDEAFFSVDTDKKEVYIGEGFNLKISFFVSAKNRAEMEFYQIGEQLTDILKDIKPTGCWEENFEIEQISAEHSIINGEQFREYKIYQATFYPLNTQPISIPSVGLKMIKYKRSKRRSFFFGSNKKQGFKTFYSKEKNIEVKPLPPHPLMDKVNVGNFKLTEKVSTKQVHTSQSFIYQFTIQGEGNIFAINKPEILSNEDFIFHNPNTEQKITRANSKVFGRKTFKFYIEPQEPGDYALKDYVHWIYFDPFKHQYDTLEPQITLNISGQSKKNETIARNDLDSFYKNIDNQNNKLKKISGKNWNFMMNIGGFLFIAICLFLILKKKKQNVK